MNAGRVELNHIIQINKLKIVQSLTVVGWNLVTQQEVEDVIVSLETRHLVGDT